MRNCLCFFVWFLVSLSLLNLNLLDLNSSGQSQWLPLQRVFFDSTTRMDFEVQPSMKRKWKPCGISTWLQQQRQQRQQRQRLDMVCLLSSIRLYLVISEQVRGRVRWTNHGRCAEPIYYVVLWSAQSQARIGTTLAHFHYTIHHTLYISSKYSSIY